MIAFALARGRDVGVLGAGAAGADHVARRASADVRSAVALNSMTFNLARAVGPASAAVAVATLGIPAAFASLFSYLVLVAALLFVRPRRRSARAGSARCATASTPPRRPAARSPTC